MEAKISDKIDPNYLKSTELKAFWALEKMSSQGDDRFKSSQIAEYLVEDIGIMISRQAISSALKSNTGKVHKNDRGYKLMNKGLAELEKASIENGVIIIEAGKPFKARSITLESIFSTLQGNLCISDPYIDTRSLRMIYEHIGIKTPVKVLTQNIVEKPEKLFFDHLEDMRKEGFPIEIGIYSNSELHDRYLFDDNTFWFSGNSLNGIGVKESFLIRLGEDVRLSMSATFNRRWKIARKV